MAVVEIFMILFNWVFSIVKTIWNVIDQWGYGILKYGLILAAVIAFFTVTGSLRKRRKLIREAEEMFEEAGVVPEYTRSPYASIFSRSAAVDLTFTVGGRKFAVKFLPGITRGTVARFYENGDVKVRRLRVFGKRRPYFADPPEEGVETVLVASAEVRGFYEVIEKNRELMPLDSGSPCHGRLVYQQKDFMRQLERVLDGYVVTMDLRKQCSDEYK